MNVKSTYRAWNLNRLSKFIFGPQTGAKASQQYFHKSTKEVPREDSSGNFQVNIIPEGSGDGTNLKLHPSNNGKQPSPPPPPIQKTSQQPPIQFKAPLSPQKLSKEIDEKFFSKTSAKTKVAASQIETASNLNSIPILLPFSGDGLTEVQNGLQEACRIGNDTKIYNTLHQAFKNTIPGHKYRGFGVINRSETDEPKIQVDSVVPVAAGGSQRPLWFIFPGLGTQWNEMGKDLMKIDAFQESMKRSHLSLKNIGMNLQQLFKPGNSDLIHNIRDASVAVAAIQIALYDTLLSLGVKPDGFIGYSSGEILCAYADGCLSAEETLLVSNARARALYDTRYSPGAMADVALAWEDSNSKLEIPLGIYRACHNAPNHITVTGPLQEVQGFVDKLQAKGIYAQLVNSCGFAPHSKYIERTAYLMFNYLHETYQGDRNRTQKWLSSSIPEANWSSPIAQTANPSYFVNNALSPVLFHEVVQKIPQNAVVVEIAPDGKFQTILKGTLDKSCTSISPMDAKVEDKLGMFVSSLGLLYNAGVEMDLTNLYPSFKIPSLTDSASPESSQVFKQSTSPIDNRTEILDRVLQ